jgi:ComEC/Rec2-related protein
MKQPLGIGALLYLAGLLIAEFYQPPLVYLFGISVAVAITATLASRTRRYLIGPLLILTAWTNLTSRTAIVSPNDLRTVLDGSYEDVIVRGVLCGTPEERTSIRDERLVRRTMAHVQVTELRRSGEWQPVSGQIVVSTPGTLAADFFAGQHVEISGILSFPPLPVAEGLFDYRDYLRRQGIYFELRSLSSDEWHLVEPRATRRPLSDRFLEWAKSTLARGLPEEDESLRLLWAMTLGWRGLPNDIYEPFMQTGTMHIFAISGLHIAMIAGILVAVLRVAQVSRIWCGAVVIPLIWCYTAVTGWQPSAIRATIMMSIIVGGWALKRPSNLLNSLAAAALIILLWQPQQLFQAGFQLSFLVVLSIALFLPPLEKVRDRVLATDPMRPAELLPRWQRVLRPPLRWLLTAVAVSLAAWLGSWPLTAYYFHLFSPVTLLANLVIVPLSSAALASSLGSLLCGGWFPWATELFNHSAWFWMQLMVGISRQAAATPGAFFHVPAPTLPDFVVCYGTLFAILSGWVLAAQRRKWAVLATLALASFYVVRWHQAQGSVTITAIPLNGGSSVFCDAPGRRNDLLIDCGNTNPVESVLIPFLHSQGVNSISQLLLTHGDRRSVGGTEPLRATIHVGEMVTSNVRFRSPSYKQIRASLPHRRGSWRSVNCGDQIGNWKVLHPDSHDEFAQADDGAVVLHGSFHGTRVLLLSDLGKPGQSALIERHENLRAEVIITGLPEQGEPVSDILLDAARPTAVVVVDSQRPATRRAGPKLQARLERRGITVIYTRNSGAATITINDHGWILDCADGQRISSRLPSIGPMKACAPDPEETSSLQEE